MKKIDIRNYKIQIRTNSGKQTTLEYDVLMSIENVVLATGPMTKQRLSMVELLTSAKVMEKIRSQAKEDFALIEDYEYGLVRKAFDSFTGFGVNEVELCRRIMDAETVQVKEKK